MEVFEKNFVFGNFGVWIFGLLQVRSRDRFDEEWNDPSRIILLL
jgi:hypothetical protein